jgi:DNA polymerase-1
MDVRLSGPSPPRTQRLSHDEFEVMAFEPWQLLGEHRHALAPGTGHLRDVRAPKHSARTKRIVDLPRVPDFIALRGDPSDKLPGAKGVGARGAAALLRQYATLEDALVDGRFPLQADELRLYRRIAAMDATAPLPSLDDQTPTWDKAAVLARSWELNRLAERLEEIAAVGTQDS